MDKYLYGEVIIILKTTLLVFKGEKSVTSVHNIVLYIRDES